jgi:hypothetical protein
VAGRSFLLHAASFLHSRAVTCLSTCIGKPESTFKSLFCFSLCCCPNTTRFDRNKLISSPAQTKIVRTLPVKAEACFPCPSISKSCSCSFSRPPSRMHADVFVSLPLSPSRRLAYCTCDTPRMSLDSLGIILRRCTYTYKSHALGRVYSSTSLSILNSGSWVCSDSRVPISSNAAQISGYLSLAHVSTTPFLTCPGAALYTDPILSTN